MWDWHYRMMDYGWGTMGAMMLFGLVFLVLIVVAVVWFARGLASSCIRPAGEQRLAGLDILEERYARGEIGRDEFLQKKRDILEHAASS